MNRRLVLCLIVLVSACTRTPSPAVAPPSAADTDAAIDASTRFVDRVWRVESSSAVAAGTLYAFRSDGSLIISAAGQSPGYGRWTYERGALVMIEEGIAYPTDILVLNDRRFSIRSHNPGMPVDIVMALASDVALPEPVAK